MKIKTILKNSASIVLAVIIAASTFSFNSYKATAWEQGANGSHEEINKYAVSRFLSAAASNAKFANSPIDTSQQFWGNETTSATLGTSDFTIQKSNLTFSQWVTHGGFSADEPEVWACVRHFYDPLAVNGVTQLTDHLALHGLVYTTISAKEWTFNKDENPYGWSNALSYYKMAMEIPDDSKITVVKGIDFRDTDIEVSSAAEARSVYLAKAFRALGETMHMIADITQPSHVRNDSHPSIDTDPLESTVNKDTVRLVKNNPVEPAASDIIDTATDLEDLYENLAIYTNKNFYTDDTVSDKASGVKQSNHENPYPHPQFNELTLDPKTGVYSKTFNGKPVRMIQKTFTSYVLGPLWTDYTVPAAFATEQAEVLVPIAIKANTKVINSFFPTFDLTLDVKENKDASTDDNPNYQEYSLETQLKHLTEKDAEWQIDYLAIKYSGPAELWGETKGKASKIANLKFKEGLPVNPVTLFVGDEKLQKDDKYQINNIDTLYVTINAGGRAIKSKKFLLSVPVKLSISPSTLNGEPNKDYTFTAKTDQPVAKARYDWFLDDKQVQSGTGTTYKFQPKNEGDYDITAKLFDKDGKELAIGEAAAAIKKPAEPAPGDLKDTKYLSVRIKATIGNDFGAGKVNIPITWNGVSFTGSYNGASDRYDQYPISLTVTGAVSPDGKRIQRLTYAQQLTFTVQQQVETTRFESIDLPLFKKSTFDEQTHLIYMVTGAECKTHMSSIDVSVDSVPINMINPETVVAVMGTFKLNNTDSN